MNKLVDVGMALVVYIHYITSDKVFDPPQAEKKQVTPTL